MEGEEREEGREEGDNGWGARGRGWAKLTKGGITKGEEMGG